MAAIGLQVCDSSHGFCRESDFLRSWVALAASGLAGPHVWTSGPARLNVLRCVETPSFV